MASASRQLIAVVDDEASLCRSVVRLLRAAGFLAEGFGSAAEFLDWLETETPDCVVLDLQMPAMTGVELLSELGGRLPVVVMTAYHTVDMEERCLALGAGRYLLKPFGVGQLTESIYAVTAASG